MIEILLYVVIGLATVVVIAEIVSYRRNAAVDLPRLWQTLDSLEKSSQATERSVREEIGKHGESVRAEIGKLRDENAAAARQSREEQATALKSLEDTLNQNVNRLRETVDQKLQRLQEDTARQLTEVRADSLASAKTLRDEIAKTLAGFHESLTKNIGETVKVQQGQLEAFSARLDKVAGTTEAKLQSLQDDSARRIEQLQTELQAAEKRLAESVRLVGERVEQAAARLTPPR